MVSGRATEFDRPHPGGGVRSDVMARLRPLERVTKDVTGEYRVVGGSRLMAGSSRERFLMMVQVGQTPGSAAGGEFRVTILRVRLSVGGQDYLAPQLRWPKQRAGTPASDKINTQWHHTNLYCRGSPIIMRVLSPAKVLNVGACNLRL